MYNMCKNAIASRLRNIYIYLYFVCVYNNLLRSCLIFSCAAVDIQKSIKNVIIFENRKKSKVNETYFIFELSNSVVLNFFSRLFGYFIKIPGFYKTYIYDLLRKLGKKYCFIFSIIL